MSDKLLSIIIPIYNEEKIADNYLPTIFSLDINKEIIIINDGSTDKTQELLEKLQKSYTFRLINQPSNQGKGAAIRRGLIKISGDYFIICDADAEYDPQDIIPLFKAAKNEINDNVAFYGSRFLNNRSWSFHYLVNSFLTIMTNILFDTKLTDMETCFKLIPRHALKKINLTGNRFEIEPEITAQLLKAGYKIKELPISYKRRGYKDGKKIKAWDGYLAIQALIKEKLKN